MGVTGMSYRAASPSQWRASECGQVWGKGGLSLGAATPSTVDSRQENGGQDQGHSGRTRAPTSLSSRGEQLPAEAALGNSLE